MSRQPLSDIELERRLGRERLDALSFARFGAVMITEDVLSGRRTPDIMFRQEPDSDFPFSGWVFLSSEESADASPDERGLEFQECVAILRVAPEVATYLDQPPGTQLVRSDDETFEPDTEDETHDG